MNTPIREERKRGSSLQNPLLLFVALVLGCNSTEADPGADAGTHDGSTSPPAWRTVLDSRVLDRALLSVWGTAPNDVFAVGGPLGNTPRTALALHFDGATWTDLGAGGDDSFWWVHGTSATDVWMVGEKGRITHWNGSAFREWDRPTTATLYGVIAFTKDDAWAVGGTPEKGTSAPNDVVLHWDGNAWTPETLPETKGRTFFKAWGTSAQNLFVVGEAGTVWHRTTSGWALEPTNAIATGTLLTVTGCSADEIYAVGNRDVLRRDSSGWRKEDVTLTNSVNGVACAANGDVALVGTGGLKLRRAAGAWVDEMDQEPFKDLHAAWADSSGAFWAVGGEFVSRAMPGQPRGGVVARHGTGGVSSVFKGR